MNFRLWLELHHSYDNPGWLESKQFKRLIPEEVLVLVPKLKEKAEELNILHPKIPDKLDFVQIPDHFFPKDIQVSFISSKQWNAWHLNGQGVCSPKPVDYFDGRRVVLYRIPLTGMDTIYHELVHAYDPKLIKNYVQSNLAPHEIDAKIGGYLDIVQDRLQTAIPQDVQSLISWMKNPGDFEYHTLPKLLSGMTLWHLRANPILWKKFITSLYAILN